MTSYRSSPSNMDILAKQKQVVDDVFSATGAKLAQDDPLVVAALFYSHEMRVAGKEISESLEKATTDLRDAAQLALPAHGAAAAERAKLMRDIETHIVRCVKTASAAGGRKAHPYVPAWYALAGAIAGALLLWAAWMIGIDRGSARADEAAVGRAFARGVSTMDPKLKALLMDHLQNHPE